MRIPIWIRIGRDNQPHLLGYATTDDVYVGQGPREVAALLRDAANHIDEGAEALEVGDIDDLSTVPLSRRRLVEE